MISRAAILTPAFLLYAVLANADVFVRDDIITEPVPSRFSVCYDHSCQTVQTLGFSGTQWQRVRRVFQPPSANAHEERTRIARAVAIMETMVGKMTGTDRDQGGTLLGLGHSGQMDCIDESTNSSIYLVMLHRSGLLQWHTVEDRVNRGFFLFGWPHTSAAIRETKTDQVFVVDSWFEDNGKLPYILPLKSWKSGWRPDD